MDPDLLTGVGDDNDNDASLAGVPIPIMTNDNNDDLDSESDHNSVDPNEVTDNSSNASIHSTGAMHQFTIQLMNHHNILGMRKSWMT